MWVCVKISESRGNLKYTNYSLTPTAKLDEQIWNQWSFLVCVMV